MKRLIEDGTLVGEPVAYATGQLVIMVPKGDSANIHGLADLGKLRIRLSMKNPELEGVARQIQASLEKAGGKDLLTADDGQA